MEVIYAESVDAALYQGLHYLERYGVREPSRNGDVLVSPMPVTTVYSNPINRVIRNPVRDANPFFHLFESIWMLAGRNDVEFPSQFAKQLAEYTDDGSTIPGAYGHRWRRHFGYDQLPIIIKELRENPSSRRCVLAMWDGAGERDFHSSETNKDDWHIVQHPSDLHKAVSGGKDVPCNTQVYFRVNAGMLDMTVTCRSNDIVWGAYGANAVHFSILQEFVARAVGVLVGRYYQLSNNYHLYTERPDVKRLLAAGLYGLPNGYPEGETVPLLADNDWENFLNDCERFCHNPKQIVESNFLSVVAYPMYNAYQAHKADNTATAIRLLDQYDHDWARAGSEWMQRRLAAKLAKQAALGGQGAQT